jgi:hypothetical protein
MLLSVKSTPSPNFHKFIPFLFSILCSNPNVESVFSTMKHLCNDKQNRMLIELIAAQLKIHLNLSLPCTDACAFFIETTTVGIYLF